MSHLDHTLCIAPMMAYTDRHFRYLLRLLSQSAVLYTEMVTDNALIHGDRHDLLRFSPEEHPIAVQLGGSDPARLAQASRITAAYPYDEINLNVGCPSERVQNGCFGAALMKAPALVAECVSAMQEAVTIPITVKTRLGVDEYDSDYFLMDFIGKVAEAGCTTFILHARKAWLSGLSPKENRTIPPLQYDRVYQVKKALPALKIIINGGITTQPEIDAHLQQVDGVMLGRAVCANSYLLAEIGGKSPTPTREAVCQQYLEYARREYEQGMPLRHLTRHLMGLYQGQPGAKQWRKTLSDTSLGDHELLRSLSCDR